MSDLKCILVAGKAGAGKSSVAAAVKTLLPATQEVAFAGPMKDFVQNVFCFSNEQVWGPSEARNALHLYPADDSASYWLEARIRFDCMAGPHLRDWCLKIEEKIKTQALWDTRLAALTTWFMQLRQSPETFSPRIALQTLGTEFGRLYLGLDAWATIALREAQSTDLLSVISDCRFENELALFRGYGAKTILVIDESQGPSIGETHASERGLNEIDPASFSYVFRNKKAGLDVLRNEVDGLLQLWGFK